MIFKYFTYDKIAKDWVDTKSYFAICVPDAYNKNLRALFYQKLMLKKKISMSYDHFNLNDSSNYPNIKTYTVSMVKDNKKWNVCRLTQLPDKDNAVNNAKIKSSWNTFTYSSTPRRPSLTFGDPWIITEPMQVSIGAWDAPRTHTYQAPAPVRVRAQVPAPVIQPAPVAEPILPAEQVIRIWDEDNVWDEDPI